MIRRKDPLLGKRVNNYRIISVLGRGGFGSVYEAVDKKLGRKAALKFLIDSSDDLHSHLFEREAKAIAALSKHPNIVQIYGWDDYKGQNYFALEYVDSSVEDLLKSSPRGLPVKMALGIAAECAEALAHAHAAEILHRDVKPANILIESETKTAKLADFGLARIRGVSQKTIDGSVIGSPTFMSPEQVRGATLTKRTDIYSLGVTLYQMLCGRCPAEGDSHLKVLDAIRNNEGVPLRKRRSKLREEILAIVEKATAHEAKKRYKSADQFAKALHAALNLEARATIEIEKRASRNRRRYALAAALMLLAAVLFTTLRTPDSSEAAAADMISAANQDADPYSIKPLAEKTKDGLKNAGDYVVEKGKNTKDRLRTFIWNKRKPDSEEQEQAPAE